MESSESLIKHPYLRGNYAPTKSESFRQRCEVSGSIPRELAGGQYVRNGGNPLAQNHNDGDMHWFDGHGMLSSVYFEACSKDSPNQDARITALYTNRYVLTDIFQVESTRKNQHRPIAPSVATLINPLSSRILVIQAVILTLWAVVKSFWSRSVNSIRRISAANTNIVFHDGRALVLCESGPPMRVLLPDLETVGWFDESLEAREHGNRSLMNTWSRFTDKGLLGFFREWTTAHPHIDNVTGEMVMFHSTFIRPFVRYSVVPSSKGDTFQGPSTPKLGRPIPGISAPRMMHDFGVSRKHTVIIDMPLTLNPFHLLWNKPVVDFDRQMPTRFGVFPRHEPDHVRWFETEACCIFHTVNTWDEPAETAKGRFEAVNMLSCRMTSASIIYAVGNIPVPNGEQPLMEEECRLYYHQFIVDGPNRGILNEWALSAIPFEFPHVPEAYSMSSTRYVYGCSTSRGSYQQQLQDTMKIGSIVKVNVAELIARGMRKQPEAIHGCVDRRSVEEIIASEDPHDPIQIFAMPEGVYAQECVFIAKNRGETEDDGWLLTFVFDESQLGANECPNEDAFSELWIIDARSMRTVVGKIKIPQRVPYGLHGNWFSKQDIENQRGCAYTR